MSDSDEEFEVVEKLAQSYFSTEISPLQKTPQSRSSKGISVSYDKPKTGPKETNLDRVGFSAPEIRNNDNHGSINMMDSFRNPREKRFTRNSAHVEDNQELSEDENPYESCAPSQSYREAASQQLGSSGFIDDSFFPPSCPEEAPSSRALDVTQNWDELTESEVGYRRREQKELGSYFRDFSISHLSKPVADPTNSITLIVIGDRVNPEDAATIGGMLARSVNRTEITDNSSGIGDRPPLRLFNLTESPFSDVLLHLSAMQAARDRGLLVPPIDLCVCLIDTEKIMRPKLDLLRKISESVNLLPLLTQPADIPDKIEHICKKLLAERLAEAGVIYYTLSPDTGRLVVGATGKDLEATPPAPCATVFEFSKCPVFQLVMAWPTIRKLAHDKQKNNPVYFSHTSQVGLRSFVTVMFTILVAASIYYLRLFAPSNVNAEISSEKVQVHIPANYPVFKPAESPVDPTQVILHSDDLSFQDNFKPSGVGL
ncbi:hypothetical protein DSO57_1024998 [Entomophthora muscae]|uniref:Uncharacterized protein n=1 Tax=Entomophthora muscae TaxID=34485 RepID=A0ACC2U0C9_9FUNG|nr:hypothetical protein DSO57_1024998 [Entomophthora muscae]